MARTQFWLCDSRMMEMPAKGILLAAMCIQLCVGISGSKMTTTLAKIHSLEGKRRNPFLGLKPRRPCAWQRSSVPDPKILSLRGGGEMENVGFILAVDVGTHT
jgi:hypothetical protein